MPVARLDDEDYKPLFVDEDGDGFDDNLQGTDAVEQPLAEGQLSNQPVEPQPQVPTPVDKGQPGATATLESLLDDNKQEVYNMQERGNAAAAPLTARADRLETSDKDLDRQSNANMFAGIANSISTGLDGATSFKDRRMDNSEARKQNTQIAENVTKEQAARQAISEKLRARAEQERSRELNTRVAGVQAENTLNAGTVAQRAAPLDLKSKQNSVTAQQNQFDDRTTALNKTKEESDPTSEVSKNYRESFRKAYPKLADMIPDSMSAARIKEMSKNFEKRYEIDQADETKRQLAKDKMTENSLRWAAQKTSQDDLKFRKDQAKTDKADKDQKEMDFKEKKELDKNVAHFTERLAKTGLPAAHEALQTVDSLIKKAGKDLPGYGSVAGGLHDAFVTKEGTDLRQAVRKLFNTELKLNAGSAVSSNELTRLKEQFGTGKWATEEQLKFGLKQYAKALAAATNNEIGGVDPKAKAEYEKRNPNGIYTVLSDDEVEQGKQQRTSAGSSKAIKAGDLPPI